MAMPGAGMPRNEVFCVSSTLNLAKRMAENTVNRNAKQGNTLMPAMHQCGRSNERLISQYMMNPGATPKETTSDKESKSAPMGEWTLSSRAVKPSKKSKRPATKIISAALTGMFWVRNRMDRQPETRLPQVMALGICCLRRMRSRFYCHKGSYFFRTLRLLARKALFLQDFLI